MKAELYKRLFKARFDSLLSSYFGESASNLRMVFDYCKNEPVVLLLDECDFIAKSRTTAQDVGEVPRIVNMLLTLLDEYDAPGLVIATTNLKVSLDEALFRRFDDVIEMALPGKIERKRLLEMTLSAIPTSPDIDLDSIAEQMDFATAISNNVAKSPLMFIKSNGWGERIIPRCLGYLVMKIPRAQSSALLQPLSVADSMCWN